MTRARRSWTARAARSARSRTVAVAPLPASNGVGDLAQELAYAKANGFAGVNLVNGTTPFNCGRIL